MLSDIQSEARGSEQDFLGLKRFLFVSLKKVPRIALALLAHAVRMHFWLPSSRMTLGSMINKLYLLGQESTTLSIHANFFMRDILLLNLYI